MADYYADLNPRFGAKYERKYMIFIRLEGEVAGRPTHVQFATRKAAENNAEKLNAQEADPIAEEEAEQERADNGQFGVGA